MEKKNIKTSLNLMTICIAIYEDESIKPTDKVLLIKRAHYVSNDYEKVNSETLLVLCPTQIVSKSFLLP